MAMSPSSAFLSEDQFSCSICLDVFSSPVSTPCGHSFCQACICSYWDAAGGGGGPSCRCPLCSQTFGQRPELHVNRTLQEITEQFKQLARAEEQEPHPHPQAPPPRPGEMPGSVIAEMRTRFQHLPNRRPPPPAPPLRPQDPPPAYSPPRRSSLSGPAESCPSPPLCPVHLRALEFFCRTDQSCVCRVCAETADHRGHSVVPAKREWDIKKSQLGISEVELKDLIRDREAKLQQIHTQIHNIKAAAEQQTGGAVCVFSKLINTVQQCQAQVLQVIDVCHGAAEHRAQRLQRELEEEIQELRKRSHTLSQLTQTEDYMLFLKTFPVLSSPVQTKDWSGVCVESELTSGSVLRTVNQSVVRLEEELRQLPDACQRSLQEASGSRTNAVVRRVQEYAACVTLDPLTAHPRLVVSADARRVHCGDRHQTLPDRPERFDRVVCVLAQQGFSSGRHYWEVDVGGKTDWDLGVASRSINRKGKITVSPAHGFWFLSLRDRTEYAFRTEPSTNLELDLRPSRIGIYLDYDQGLLSFYNVEAGVLIYTFSDTFTDVIHPFFSPCTNKSGRNEAPLVLCPPAPR